MKVKLSAILLALAACRDQSPASLRQSTDIPCTIYFDHAGAEIVQAQQLHFERCPRVVYDSTAALP